MGACRIKAVSLSGKDILSYDYLYKGLKDSCKNVRWKSSVVSYELHGLTNTYLLKRDGTIGCYKIQKYPKFMVYEPKKREVTATRIRDRQFQHSLVDNYLYDELTKSFIYDNCACQKNKGVDFCLNRLTRHLRKYYIEHGNNGYALKCDIHHFFQSIPHSALKEAVRKRINDDFIIGEVDRIIDSFGGNYGIGLGSQVSQLLALAVLDDLDHYIKEKLHIKYYIRYMDDLVLIHEDKEYLKYCLSEIKKKLNEIGLKLNNKTGFCKLNQGIKMLQWRFILTRSGHVVRRMNEKKTSRQCKKMKKLYIKEQNKEVPIGTCHTSASAFMANAKRGDTYQERCRVNKFYGNITGVYFYGSINSRAKAC